MNGKHVAQTPVDQRFSLGKNQPYAADPSQQKPQKPLVALQNQPHTTLPLRARIVASVADPGGRMVRESFAVSLGG